MKKIHTLFIATVLLAPIFSLGHYVPRDLIHIGDVNKKLVFLSNLTLGSKGEEVKVLQELLAKVPNIYPQSQITGYFGPLTVKAVIRLQKQNGLDSVGRVGPRTRALLQKILNTGDYFTYGYQVPMINVIEGMGSSSTTAYVFWTTNKNTTSEFWYSSTTPLNTLTANKLVDNTFSMSHSHNLSGLMASTTYYYIIKVSDERPNSATSTERSFVTL